MGRQKDGATGDPQHIFFYRISERIFSAVRRLSLVKGWTYLCEIWQASSDLQSGGIHQIFWRSRHRFDVIFTHT